MGRSGGKVALNLGGFHSIDRLCDPRQREEIVQLVSQLPPYLKCQWLQRGRSVELFRLSGEDCQGYYSSEVVGKFH